MSAQPLGGDEDGHEGFGDRVGVMGLEGVDKKAPGGDAIQAFRLQNVEGQDTQGLRGPDEIGARRERDPDRFELTF